ncbi:hypothetical protein [Microbacterium sp. SA39]|uniref:hypothetical protein n=1 Tax=Microbacterium sp. SA39 TaxID=1263625 RepID=UPI0005FA6398|nr:hypothetical protein [Microbacterium sp. SA39]KJQ54385.1 hypothetical protein RS85_01987 [Microbacterium sp. SA39]
MADPLYELRALTRTLTSSRRSADSRPSDKEIDLQLVALQHGAATFQELGPVPAEWRSAGWWIDNQSHPFSLRFHRQRASGWLQELARNHPEAISADALAAMHEALFDVCAAVAENTIITLGLLQRPDSRGPLERFQRLMAQELGWETIVELSRWSLLRITDPESVEPPRGTPDEPVLAVRRLGPDIVHLARRGDSLLLRNPDSGVEEEISQVEAHIFENTSDARLDRYFSGVENLGEPLLPSRLAAVATGLNSGLPLDDVLATLTDTTTVQMAGLTVRGLLRPEGLLDLSTLVHCCVFYDFVLVDAEDIELPVELEGVIVPVRPYETSDVDPRWSIANERDSALRSDPELRKQLESRWSEMLGRPVRIDFRSFDSITDSPGVTQYFPGGPGLGFYDPVATVGGEGEQASKSLDRDISVQTFRYWINETVAATLGVAYNCTTLRYPVEGIALARRSAYPEIPDQLLSRVARHPGSVLEQPTQFGYLSRVRVPNLLGIVLKNSARREDIWAEILELRRQFKPVRDYLRDGRAHGRLDSESFNLLMKKMFGKASAWDVPVDTAITLASTVASPTLTGAGGVALKMAAVTKPAGHIKRIVDRITRPEVYVLRKFADDVALLSNEVGHIERLWGESIDRGWLATAARISQGSANEGRTLHQ